MNPGARLGPYEIIAPLGAGGMGEVYRARDARLERDIALKVLPAGTVADPTARARLLREARMAARLNHPHVCNVHDVGESDGLLYIAMELVEGESLATILANGPLSVEQALRYGVQIAGALAHAHSRGVVHRDLKSANVVIAPEGQAKVLDFGLAKPLAGQELAEATTLAAEALTRVGTIAGTPAYMAPEQLRGRLADARSDVWALGIVLYEMVTGERPFRGTTAFELSSAILSEPPPPLPGTTPTPLAAVIERCLAKEAGERFQRAGEVRDALETIRSGSVVPGLPRPAPTRTRRRFLLAPAALVAVVALLAALDVGGVRSRLLGPAGGGRTIRMAVLPFANLSGDPEQEYLSDGLTQEMIAQLGRLHPETLSVIARTSVMRYKNTETPIDQIGRELKVGYVLEGSAQREGSRVRITAELIRVEDQSQLWADSLEREMVGIMALQSDVARNVAGALALKLLPAEQARLAGARQVNPEAYEAYLKGSQHWIKMTKGDLDTAEGYFNLAIEKDPDFAPAYAGMAWAWGVRGQQGWSPLAEAEKRSREATLKALSLDPTLAEVHYLLATDKTWGDWDMTAAEREWARAVELDPNYPDGLAMYSHYLAIVGRTQEAMAEIDRALTIDPFNVTIHSFRAIDLLFARRFDDALTQAQKAVAMEPGHFVALTAKYLTLAATGKTTETVDALKDYVVAIGLPDVARALDQGFSEAGFAGATKRGAEALAVDATQGKAGALPIDVAQFYALAGENTLALDWLERAYEARDPNMPYLGLPVYDPLRSEPRFQALLRKVGLPPG